MKNKIFSILLIVSFFLILNGCSNGNSSTDKLSKIYLSESWNDEIIEINLSRPLTLPLNKEDPSLIRDESGCTCTGELKLVDDVWIIDCCLDYPDCEIKIDVNTGEVMCNYFG